MSKIEGLRLDDVAAEFWSGEKERCKQACRKLAKRLFDLGAGEAALCALMLSVDAGQPKTFNDVLPLLDSGAEHLWRDAHSELEMAEIRCRLSTWSKAAEGHFEGDHRSIFWIAHLQLIGTNRVAQPVWPSPQPQNWTSAAEPEGLSVVVMPKAKSSKLGAVHEDFKDMVDAKLPLVIAREVRGVRDVLSAEYPHAVNAIDVVLRELREGYPVRLKPLLLVGPPGNGKSRLVRRIGQLLGLEAYRIDGSSSTDAVAFGGTPKAWSNTVPCAPARAICQTRIANVICFVDEIDKSATSQHNGRLVHAILPHLERETACCYRDSSLDAELDLSWVVHIATANSTKDLPEPLTDRYRIINIPPPRLADLPLLAANVMRELAIEIGEEAFVQSLANDELDVIARAWSASGFSLRKLRLIISATLELRYQTAVRH
ncbi:AAA family ATPase [Bradyrhizobium sp. USDA 329]|uniref:AAA family ATPase n=1 Tax=unclassified Bradyrhizobium TaxID=2631580 RepID=UPI00351696AD